MNKEFLKVYAKYLMWFDFLNKLADKYAKKKIYIDINDSRSIQMAVTCQEFHKIEKYLRIFKVYFGLAWEKMEQYHKDEHLFIDKPLTEKKLLKLYEEFNK